MGCHALLQGIPNPGIEPSSLVSPALADGSFATSATWEAQSCQWVETVRGHQRCVLVFHMLPLSSKYTLPLCQRACLLSPPPADTELRSASGRCRRDAAEGRALPSWLCSFSFLRLLLGLRCFPGARCPQGVAPSSIWPLPPVLS